MSIKNRNDQNGLTYRAILGCLGSETFQDPARSVGSGNFSVLWPPRPRIWVHPIEMPSCVSETTEDGVPPETLVPHCREVHLDASALCAARTLAGEPSSPPAIQSLLDFPCGLSPVMGIEQSCLDAPVRGFMRLSCRGHLRVLLCDPVWSTRSQNHVCIDCHKQDVCAGVRASPHGTLCVCVCVCVCFVCVLCVFCVCVFCGCTGGSRKSGFCQVFAV